MKTTIKIVAALMIILSCYACQSPVTLTSWKNPDDHTVISKVVVFPLFNKLEYTKPFEQAVVTGADYTGVAVTGMEGSPPEVTGSLPPR